MQMTEPRLVHSAFFYHDDREYLDEVVPFVRAGVALGDPVSVVVPADKLALLRSVLEDVADRVDWSDMREVGRNPANTFAKFAVTLDAMPPERRMWVVAEPVWPGRTPDEYPACVQNEALYNKAFAEHNLVTLCPYDAARLSPEALEDARCTHPLIRRNGSDIPCEDYSWEKAVSDFNQPLTSDPTAVAYRIGTLGDLSEARSFAAERARAWGMAEARIGDLYLIITELATNSLKYAGGGCRLAMWVRDGKLVCEIRDGGRLEDIMVGRRPPAADSTGGRGLLLVNAIADLVRVHTSASGTTIQVHLPLSSLEASAL